MKKINKCRFCKSRKLSDVLKLGNQFLTGVFLKNKNSKNFKRAINTYIM